MSERPHTIEFGLNIPTSAGEGDNPIAEAIAAEELGFDFVSSSDHPGASAPTNETWTMLCLIAAATSRIRVATRVLGVPYRAPAMIAKMAETLHRLSGERLILGLGAGSADEEHRAFGLGVRSPKEKTDGLEEAVRIIRGLWSEREFSFSGRIYQTEAADLEPKPRRPIPIWLGTFAPRALAVTGRLADGWIPSLSYAPPKEVVVLRRRVLEAAEAAGRDPSALICAYNIEVEVTDEHKISDERIAGPPAFVIDELRKFMDIGFSAFNFMLIQSDRVEQARRVAAEVVAPLREITGVRHEDASESS